jgi:isopenicillin N synthase-like dioxygenase
VDYIELTNLDLSKFDDPESRKELARDFYQAFTEEGFATVSDHGISKEAWDLQINLANAVMTMAPEEKVPYEGMPVQNTRYNIQETHRHLVTPEEDARGIYVGFKQAGGKGFHKEVSPAL